METLGGKQETWSRHTPEHWAIEAGEDPSAVVNWMAHIQAALGTSRLELAPGKTYEIEPIASSAHYLVPKSGTIIEGRGATIKLKAGAKMPAGTEKWRIMGAALTPGSPPVNRITVRDLIFDLNGHNQADEAITLSALNMRGHYLFIERCEARGIRAGQHECFVFRVEPDGATEPTTWIAWCLVWDPASNAAYQGPRVIAGQWIPEITAFGAGHVWGCLAYGDKTATQLSSIHPVAPASRNMPTAIGNYGRGTAMGPAVWVQYGSEMNQNYSTDGTFIGNGTRDRR